MALIGPHYWRAVTTETAGVPHGGAYGDVERFAARMKPHGLTVVWLPNRRLFGLARRWGAKWIFQCTFEDDISGQPVPMTDALAGRLLQMWDRFSRSSPDAMRRAMEEAEARHKQEAAKAAYERLHDRPFRDDVISRTKLRLGKRSPKAMAIPSGRVQTIIVPSMRMANR